MNSLTILTIEDDAAIRGGLVDALEFSGYRVLQSSDGTDGLKKATTTRYDLLLLDLALPGTPGLEILREVRRVRPSQAVIILTAKGQESDRVTGLRLGADDYVVKPFSVKELVARVQAVLRRSPERTSVGHEIEFPSGTICLARRELQFLDGQIVDLSEKETELIRYLVANEGRAVSRDELLRGVWGLAPQGITTRTIDMHVARLREKLRDSGSQRQLVQTVRGKGYKWSRPAMAASDSYDEKQSNR
ncbi:response regulator transcription factor [Allorhodopirellula solitaria]|uniref:Alkaline phosphatase synthesis transcriptional regulatory protein PhoP n=1 Tax=Allorhodopirellula solitaria TaxID=2527987 RepID=A0A5C5Y1E5_9BACT|nr:response regulator transcription factor [Allorhodopirellula solitaria]TWT67422.1 Alkaline phosphatase synthesis transcriptional regulatory protein PhoP [Allorhodopirellula solitaria]